MKHCLIVLVCLLFPLSLMCKETRETGQNADKRYEEIVKSVKDNPGQALADLKKLADKKPLCRNGISDTAQHLRTAKSKYSRI